MTARRAARPRFIWQGTLIILPALILAAAGLHSLRQDRAFAEHGALLEARRHATTIAEKRLPEQLFTPLPAASSVLRWLAASPTATTPPEDPLMLALPETLHERVAFLADAAGELIHPPRINGHPIASPLNREDLTSSQQAAWTEWLSNASSGSDDSEGGIGPLLAAPLPDRWIAIARFRSALAARAAGQTTVAARLFRSVIDRHPDAVGETGTSLRPLAALELARISPDEGLAVLRMESARMVRAPDALTGALLDQAASLDEECALWRETFQRHEAVRALHRALTEASREPARFAGREYFSFSQLDADGQWIFVLSQDALQAAFARAIANQTLPPHFGATIS